MRRVAIVVQRCHEALVGGAESLAWQYATLLADSCDVEVLTTTASDYVTWANDLPEGEETRDGVTIRRFPVARQRGDYFHALHHRLLGAFEADPAAVPSQRIRWPESLQEEFIQAQGPVSPGLVAHLRRLGDSYDAVLFVTYLYAPTYEGTQALGHRRWALVPTLHDEPPAYLGVFARMARGAPRLLWNARAEQRLGKKLWGVERGSIVSMTVATRRFDAAREEQPYLLYSGRVDVSKGCRMLIDSFTSYALANPSTMRLLLTGADKLGVRETEDVRYLGFVEEARKFELMAGALAFVHPSPYESLSIVVLEAMAQGTPVIVNGRCEVLADHVEASGSGWVFHDEGELHAAIDAVRALTEAERASIGQRARDYVLANYDRSAVQERLFAEIDALAATQR